MSADRFDEMACELHKALGLEGFESDKPKIAAALRRVADEECEACAIIAETTIGYHPYGVFRVIADAIRKRGTK